MHVFGTAGEVVVPEGNQTPHRTVHHQDTVIYIIMTLNIIHEFTR